MGNNDAALEAIRVALGASASVLQHLPSNKVKLEPFDDSKGDRPNTMPVRMLFGQIKEGKDKDNTVWVLLQLNHSAERSPHQFFNIFDRFNKIQGQISSEEAVQRTNPATAFKCLKKSGNIDEDQLRAVVKLYFIMKGINTSSPWVVGTHFMKSLKAACIVAKEYEAKAAANREKEKGHKPAAQKAHGIKPKPNLEPEVLKPRVMDDKGVSAKVGELPATAISSVTKTTTTSVAKARPNSQPPNMQRAPTASMIPSTQELSDLFIPEGPHVKAASDASINRTRFVTPDIPKLSKAMKSPPSHPLPLGATATLSRASSVNKNHGFLIHSDSDDGDNNSAAMNISPSASARTKSIEVFREKSPNSPSSDNFVPAYRKIINDEDAIKDEIKANKKEQKVLREEIQARRLEQDRIEQTIREQEDAKLANLGEKQQKLKEGLRLNGPAKKRLRESLSAKERALLVLGMEVAEKRLKRSKTSAQSEEGTSGEED